jgi:hypothetical protein
MISVRELLGPKDPAKAFTLREVFQDRLAGLTSVRDAQAVLAQQIEGKPETIETTTLFPEYLPESLVELMKAVSDGLQIVDMPTNLQGNASAIATNTGRKRLKVFLNRNTLHRRCADAADGAYVALAQNRIVDVDDELKKLADEAAAAPVNELLLDRALVRQKIPFQRADPGGTATVFLPAYNGPRLSAEQRRSVLLLIGLCSRSAEFDFRTALIAAESALKQRRYGEAIERYERLRDRLAATDTAGQRLLLGREAVAHAGLADSLYREAPDATTESLRPASDEYERAESLLIASGAPVPRPGVPIGDHRTALLAHVLLQQRKIAAHLNPLGLHDSLVPTGRPSALLDLASDAIQLTKELAAQAQTFLLLANEADKAVARLDMEVAEATDAHKDAIDLQAAAAKQAQTATDAVALAADLQKIHEDKSFDLTLGSVAEYVLSAFSGSTAAIGSAFKGVISTKFDLETEETQLIYQAKAAAIQLEIANIQKGVADREVIAAQEREQFLIAQRDLLTQPNDPRTLTRDQFYQFAEQFDALARERFSKAHRLAYLYERAAAFRLGTTIDEISFAYLNSSSVREHDGTEIFTAPFELEGDLQDITEKFGEIRPPDIFSPFEINLETRFPLEFQRLRQDGSMAFLISLYDLDKDLPGASNQRVGATKVRIIAKLPSAANVSVELSHSGVAFVRDHATILSEETRRLIPTPEQVDEALQNLADGNIAGALVNGVRVLQQPPISKFLPVADGPQTEPDLIEFALGPLEDYGIAGGWSVNVRGVVPRDIHSVTLIFAVDHFAPTPAEIARVEQLVTDYEKEIRESDVIIGGELPDRVVRFDMATSFADQLEDLIAQPPPSEVSFRLNAEHFSQADFDPVNARVKGVVLQVIHLGEEAEEGVADVDLTFGHEAETPFSRVTLASGLTEDLEKDIPLLPGAERFPVLGRWQIRINDGSPVNRISDVRWFFVLETP